MLNSGLTIKLTNKTSNLNLKFTNFNLAMLTKTVVKYFDSEL